MCAKVPNISTAKKSISNAPAKNVSIKRRNNEVLIINTNIFALAYRSVF